MQNNDNGVSATRARTSSQVSAILNALEEGLPGFVRDAVLYSITLAAKRAGVEPPTFSPEWLMDGSKLQTVLELSQDLNLRSEKANGLLDDELLAFGIHDL